MSKYEELDEAILERLCKSSRPWSSLHSDMEREYPAIYEGRKENWRITDGRLQSLRRKGLIAPVRVGRESFCEIVT